MVAYRMEWLVHFGTEDNCPRAIRLSRHVPGLCRVHEGSEPAKIIVNSFGLAGRLYNFFLLGLGCFDSYLDRKYVVKAVNQPDKIVCFDLLLLLSLFGRFPSAQIYLDAREYYPLEFEHRWIWKMTSGRLASYICRTYFHRLTAGVTVSDGLRRAYEETYGRTFAVLPSYAEAHPHIKAKMPGEVLRCVYHGNASRDRAIEDMIDAFLNLSNAFELHLYLVGVDARYMKELKRLAAPASNIEIHEPVAFNELVSMLNAYDVGLFVSRPTTFNLKFCLPNKLFEYIQAKLMVVVTPLCEIARFVESKGLGKVCDGFGEECIRQSLLSISSEELMDAKAQSSRWSRELTEVQFVDAYRKILEV